LDSSSRRPIQRPASPVRPHRELSLRGARRPAQPGVETRASLRTDYWPPDISGCAGNRVGTDLRPQQRRSQSDQSAHPARSQVSPRGPRWWSPRTPSSCAYGRDGLPRLRSTDSPRPTRLSHPRLLGHRCPGCQARGSRAQHALRCANQVGDAAPTCWCRNGITSSATCAGSSRNGQCPRPSSSSIWADGNDSRWRAACAHGM
jgi:hypothetical protein